MREPLPHWVTEAMLRLEQNGEEAWLVGGCVRDRLLGRPVHDYDLTVSCLPDRTAWLFRDHRLVEDGRKHGTIGVVTEGGVLEMTTATPNRCGLCPTSGRIWPGGISQ